jgi:uncharacterized protein HemX
MTWWAWFQAWSNTNGGAVSILGVWITAAALLSGWVWARSTNKLIAQGRDTTQTLIKTVHTETQETMRQLGAGQKSLGDILDRMDRAAETRYRDLKDHLDEGTEGTP